MPDTAAGRIIRSILKVTVLLILISVLLCLPETASSTSGLDSIQKRGYLLWGSDAGGGAPYIFPDPKNPSKLIGFEVDLADEIARELGVEARQAQNAWDSLIPALMRGDSDVAMNGIEITPQREKEVFFSRPYYIYTEQLVVRKEEETIKTVNDLKREKGRDALRDRGTGHSDGNGRGGCEDLFRAGRAL